jgi:hypothetical protein
MQGFTWEQAREKALALAERTHQAVHVVQREEEYFVVPAAEFERSGEPLPTVVYTARPAQAETETR